MKILHLSDLHIGKILHHYSLIQDQEFIFNQIFDQIKEIKPQTVVIAGDIYDKSSPSIEAINLFDWFLNELNKIVIDGKNLNILIIGGNHDSDERLSFGSGLMVKNQVYISKPYNGTIEPIVLNDEFGEINFYLFPFVKPHHVREFFPDENITDYNTAVKVAIEKTNIDTNKRNIMVTHQFITSATTCDSEELSVGGSDNVSADNFKDFDYVALGHIHSPQDIKSDHTKIRYCGTPLKYSLSEANHTKSLTFLDINEKNSDLIFNFIDLSPLKELRSLKDSFENLLEFDYSEDYLYIVLTDTKPIIDAMVRLKTKFPNLLHVSYENLASITTNQIKTNNTTTLKPLDVFEDLFEENYNTKLNDNQIKHLNEIIESIWK